MAKAKFIAVCAVCFTCVIKKGTKKECELAATSHMGAFGHGVTILPDDGK